MPTTIRDVNAPLQTPSLPADIYTTAQVRSFDRTAIETLGVPGIDLMTRAGRAAFGVLMRRWPAARTLAVYCGGGNNGGDGYVVAAAAAAAGLKADVVSVVDPVTLTGDAAEACRRAVARGVHVRVATGSAASVPAADVVVDGIFGTGIARTVAGCHAQAIEAINASDRPVLALDVPSGLDSDTGDVHGIAVRADITVTFVGLKQGLYLGQAPDYCGRIEFAGLELPAEAYMGVAPVLRRIADDLCRSEFPPRPRMSHKGLNGNLLLIGGSPGMSGAVRLAAEAALRGGVGLVHVATHPDCVAAVVGSRPELMCRGVERSAGLGNWLDTADAVVIGPGLGQSGWAQSLLDAALAAASPLVVDADALNLLARRPNARGNWLLTPHPGEAGRLLGTSASAVQADRLHAVRALSERFDADVVLKGACSLVSEVAERKEIRCYVCDRGNPGMATGGMGDVLAGLAGALVAQRGSLARVARLATLIHARAGDAAAAQGERGMIASDVIAALRAEVNPS